MIRRAPLVLSLVLLAACSKDKQQEVGAGVPDAGPQALTEKEPNNSRSEALRLDGSSVVTASLGVEPARPDEDWYALSAPRPQKVDLQVSGIPGADVGLAILDADGNPLATVNSQGEGKPERLPNLGVTGTVLVRVYAAKKGSGGAYSLTALFSEPEAGFEVEPNDRAVDANPLALGGQVSGLIGHSGDEDWYRIELPVPEGGLPADPQPVPGAPEPDAGEGVGPQGEATGGTEHGDGSAPPAAEPPGLALKIGLTAVEGVRFEVQVLSEAEAQLFSIKSKEGEGLLLRNVGVRGTDRVVYVMVRSAWSGTGKEARRSFNPEKAYSLSVAQEEAGANAELEPNDDLDHATALPMNGHRDGFLSPKTDVVYYVLRPALPVLAKVQLSGVERLDLVLSVVDRGEGDRKPEAVKVRVNDGAVKEPEYFNNFYCEQVCWLKVEGASRKVDGKWVRDFENPDIPYRLTIATVPNNGSEEREPNNSIDDATPLALGRPIRGTVHPKKDVDHYRLDLSAQPVRTSLRATLTGILKVDVGLYLHRVEDGGKLTLVQTADRAKGEAPEVIRYSAEPGEYVFEVRDAKNREANFQDSYQLLVEEGE